ncbi:MAG: holin family protein [Pseudomonadota bacterium]
MGLIAGLLGLVPTLRRTAEVFVPNKTERAAQEHAEQMASLNQLGMEFQRPVRGWFDGVIDALNRLPRPALALGTLGLFAFAMADPVAFGIRMQGLALVPEPLWWLLGAIVSFYFGARELHHFRGGNTAVPVAAVTQAVETMNALRLVDPVPAEAPEVAPAPAAKRASVDNPALAEWQAQRA